MFADSGRLHGSEDIDIYNMAGQSLRIRLEEEEVELLASVGRDQIGDVELVTFQLSYKYLLLNMTHYTVSLYGEKALIRALPESTTPIQNRGRQYVLVAQEEGQELHSEEVELEDQTVLMQGYRE